MIDIKVKTVKTYLVCPRCGEFHKFDENRPAERVVCLYCDEMFDTDTFEPFAVTYRKKNSDFNSFSQQEL